MAKMVTIRGDVFCPVDTGKPMVLPHVVNDAGKWGAGFSGQLSRKYASPELTYRHQANEGVLQLGCIQVIAPPHPPHLMSDALVNCNITVVNMIAQSGINGNIGLVAPIRPQLRYLALIECMKKVHFQVDRSHADIHCPRFGSELAGGNWSAIEALIWELWVDQGIDVYQYVYEPILERRCILSEYRTSQFSN